MVLPNAGTRYSAFLNDVRVSVDTVSTVVVAPGRCLNCRVSCARVDTMAALGLGDVDFMR